MDAVQSVISECVETNSGVVVEYKGKKSELEKDSYYKKNLRACYESLVYGEITDKEYKQVTTIFN